MDEKFEINLDPDSENESEKKPDIDEIAQSLNSEEISDVSSNDINVPDLVDLDSGLAEPSSGNDLESVIKETGSDLGIDISDDTLVLPDIPQESIETKPEPISIDLDLPSSESTVESKKDISEEVLENNVEDQNIIDNNDLSTIDLSPDIEEKVSPETALDDIVLGDDSTISNISNEDLSDDISSLTSNLEDISIDLAEEFSVDSPVEDMSGLDKIDLESIDFDVNEPDPIPSDVAPQPSIIDDVNSIDISLNETDGLKSDMSISDINESEPSYQDTKDINDMINESEQEIAGLDAISESPEPEVISSLPDPIEEPLDLIEPEVEEKIKKRSLKGPVFIMLILASAAIAYYFLVFSKQEEALVVRRPPIKKVVPKIDKNLDPLVYPKSSNLSKNNTEGLITLIYESASDIAQIRNYYKRTFSELGYTEQKDDYTETASQVQLLYVKDSKKCAVNIVKKDTGNVAVVSYIK